MDTRSLWKWNHSPVKNLSLHLPGYSIGCSLHRHRQATYVSVREIEPTAPSWLRLQKSHPFSEGTAPLRAIISKGNTRCPVQRCTQFQKKTNEQSYDNFIPVMSTILILFNHHKAFLPTFFQGPIDAVSNFVQTARFDGVVNVDQIYRSSLEGAFPKRSFP